MLEGMSGPIRGCCRCCSILGYRKGRASMCSPKGGSLWTTCGGLCSPLMWRTRRCIRCEDRVAAWCGWRVDTGWIRCRYGVTTVWVRCGFGAGAFWMGALRDVDMVLDAVETICGYDVANAEQVPRL